VFQRQRGIEVRTEQRIVEKTERRGQQRERRRKGEIGKICRFGYYHSLLRYGVKSK